MIFREDVQRILGERPFGKPAEPEAKVEETETDPGAEDAGAEDAGASDPSTGNDAADETPSA